MTRLNRAAKALLILSPICSVISAKADYTPNFSSGTIPPGVTVSNSSEAKPAADFYKRGWTEDGWTVDRIGGKGYVVMAPTHTGVETPVNSVLTLPAQDVTEGMWLQWEALSLLPGFNESYQVLLTTESGEGYVLFSTAAEDTKWTLHMVSLKEFAGRKCTVSFECNSVNKYMLMLSGISIGEPKEDRVEVIDETPRYNGTSRMLIHGKVRNTGAPLKDASIVCYDADGKQPIRFRLGPVFDTNETREYAVDAPSILDTGYGYMITVEKADGTQILAETGSYYSSSFPRTLLVDKATGMWCTNCPTGNLLLKEMEQTYGDQMVAVETHIYNNDPLENVPYWDNLGFHSVPHFMLNRVKATAGGDLKGFSDYYNTPTRFGIRFGAIEVNGNESVKVGVEVQSAEEFDNGSDRYRVGYVLTADFRSDSYYQVNGCNSPSDQRYFYLPKRVPGELLEFRHVSLTSEHAFDGIAGSLPAEIVAGSETGCEFTVTRPELLENLRDGRMVVYVLDTETGEVLNAAARTLAEDYSGVSLPSADGDMAGAIANAGNGLLRVDAPAAWTLQCFDMAGRLCHTTSGYGQSMVNTSLGAGAYVARLVSAQGTGSLKFIVKQ